MMTILLPASFSQSMLLGSLALGAALSCGCRDNSPPPVPPAKPLNLYIVSQTPASGLQTLSLPPSGDTKGYVASKPDFVLSRLAAVVPTVSQSLTATSTGARPGVSSIQQESPALLLTIHDGDLPALAAFFRKTEGQSILFMIGDKPIWSPQVIQTFTDKNFLIQPDASVDRQQLEKDLKDLVR